MVTLRPPFPWGLTIGTALLAAFVATLISGGVLMGVTNSCFGDGGCVADECVPCDTLKSGAQLHVAGQAVLAAAAVFVNWRLQRPRSTWLIASTTALLAVAVVTSYVWWAMRWVDTHS
jgi:hypothetical protein